MTQSNSQKPYITFLRFQIRPLHSVFSSIIIIIMFVWMQIRRVDLDCLGVVGEVERRRLQAAVRELGLHGATQVIIYDSI